MIDRLLSYVIVGALLSMLFGAVWLFSTPALPAGGAQCAGRDTVFASLLGSGARPSAIARADERPIWLLRTEEGGWVLFSEALPGLVCVVASGDLWSPIEWDGVPGASETPEELPRPPPH